MLRFWEMYWLPFLLLLSLLLLLWMAVLATGSALTRSGEGLTASRREQRSARVRWLGAVTRKPVPPFVPESPCERELIARHGESLDVIDAASRVWFMPAIVSSGLLFAGGALEVLWTILALAPRVSPWQTVAVAVFLTSLIPYLVTIGAFHRARRRRMPFELRFLEEASWAIRNLAKLDAGSPSGVAYAQSRDVERVLLSRHRDTGLADLPTYAIATKDWLLRVAPLLAARAQLISPHSTPESARIWVRDASAVVCDPDMTFAESPDRRRIALAALHAKPKNAFGVSVMIAMITAGVVGLGILISMEFGTSGTIAPRIPEYLGYVATTAGIIGALVPAVLSVRALLRRPDRRLVELLLESNET